MKDLGIAKHYLEIYFDYHREDGKVVLCQQHFDLEILRRFVMEACKPSLTPMETKLILEPHISGEIKLTEGPYRQLAGCVIYLMLCTRSDISYVVGVLSRFLCAPMEAHWHLVNACCAI